MKVRSLLIGWLVLSTMFLLGDASDAEAQKATAHEHRLKVVAISRTVPQWELFEFFKREVEQRSGGRIQVSLTTTGELGVASFDMIRIMQSGVVDIGNVVPLHVSGTAPLLEGTELPGIFPDVATNRKAFDAWTEQVLLRNEDRVGGRVIGSFGWAGQMLFARKPVRTLADLKGSKIRVTSRSMADYMNALGAVPVTISLDELYTGLQQGTVDGATTAAATGYEMRLWENTKYLVDLNIGTPTGLLVVNKALWDRLSADLREVLTDAGKAFTERGWTQSMTLEQTGIEQNRSKGVTYIPVKAEWQPELKKAQAYVAQRWAERAGPDGRKAFNEILAPYTGFTIE